MSKRFGRNQRRRAREELAAAVTDSEWHQSRASHLQNELWQATQINTRLRQELEGAKAAIGRHHPSFAPGALDLGFLPRPAQPLRVAPYRGSEATAYMMELTVDADNIKNECHFRLYYGQIAAGYVVSENAMLNVDADFLCDRITREMTGLVVSEYRKVKGGRK